MWFFCVFILTDHLLLKPVPHCHSPSIIITKFFLRVHYLPHKSLCSHLANLITGSGFNPPCTEKPLQLFIRMRNLMECVWCSEQLPALVAAPRWGQPCCLGLCNTGTWAFLTSAARERKGKGGRRKAKKKKKGIFIRLKKGREYSGYRLKNPENSENLENF